MAALSARFMVKKKNSWYADGLHFECVQCGGCCAGPAEGFIWATRTEIELIANYLKITVSQLRRNFLKRVGLRTTIIEHHSTKDCIFLNHGLRGLHGEKRTCMIYPVRPNQCRNWPFWPNNLESLNAWNQAARKCHGINHGKFYSYEEIEKLKKSKKWWQNSNHATSFS